MKEFIELFPPLGTEEAAAKLKELKVSDEELEKRRAEYKAPEKKSAYGILRRYAAMVTSADTGARYRKV